MGQHITHVNTKLSDWNQTEPTVTFDNDVHERNKWKGLNTELSSFLMEQVFNGMTTEYHSALAEAQAKANEARSNDSSSSSSIDHHVTDTLASILLILLQSAEKHDRSVIEQILTMANQLCENLPINYFLTARNENVLYRTLVPLTKYIYQHALVNPQTIKILLGLAMAAGSLKEILPVLTHLVVHSNDTYDVRPLFIQLNNRLMADMAEDRNSIGASLLSSIGVFPNERLDAQSALTGPVIASVIFIHLEMEGFIAFEYDLTIVKELFSILNHLKTVEMTSDSVNHRILISCFHLLKDQLKIFAYRKCQEELDVHRWFDLLFHYATDKEDEISAEASKPLMHLLDSHFSLFADQLTFLRRYLLDYQYPHLTEQSLLLLNDSSTLIRWVEHLSDDDLALIDLIFHPSKELKERIEQTLLHLQQYLFIRTKAQVTSIVKYTTHLLTHSKHFGTDRHPLVDSLLLGLFYWTHIEPNEHYKTIQASLLELLPILIDYTLQSNDVPYLYWLLGRIYSFLITGSPSDALELKYQETLTSPLFAGGIESDEESNVENDFLLSIYHQTDRGGLLFNKLKTYAKTKQRTPLPKSIEDQATDACAAIFAVYLKYFRRLPLARSELSRADDQAPHKKLQSIFDYASQVYLSFAVTRGQGGDCHALQQCIKENCLFLLASVKESDSIPLIDVQHSERTVSQWTKPKWTLRLLRHTFQACLRFKRLIQAQKPDSEQQLQQAITTFIHQSHSTKEINDLKHCLHRQADRARIRLNSLQSLIGWLSTALHKKPLIFRLLIPQLTDPDFNWSYLDRIPAANDRWKEEIGNQYFTLIKTLLDSTSIDDGERNLFYLLNHAYQTHDLRHLYQHHLVEILHQRFVSFLSPSAMRMIGYQWFQFYLKQLCAQTRPDHEQIAYVFRKLIYPELKQLNQMKDKTKSTNEQTRLVPLHKIGSIVPEQIECRSDIELAINQFLHLLLHAIQGHADICQICASVEYLTELISIYQTSQNVITVLLALRVLRQLIIHIPCATDGIAQSLIDRLLQDLLRPRLSPEISTECIFLFRKVLSQSSPWQRLATNLLFDHLLADPSGEAMPIVCLSILGGEIQPYSVGTKVEIGVDEEAEGESQSAMIVDIDWNKDRAYTIQYLQTNKIEDVSIDRMSFKVEIAPPTNLLLLPVDQERIQSFIHVLVKILEKSSSNLPMLQLQRQAMAVLEQIISNKALIDMLFQNSSTTMLARLALSMPSLTPPDLQCLSQAHLEQYASSLDRCQRNGSIKEETPITTDTQQTAFITWTDPQSFHQDPLTDDLLMATVLHQYRWRPRASKREIEWFKQGRLGNDEIRVVPLPSEIGNPWLLEECGTNYLFSGRTYLISESNDTSLGTFTIDNVQVSEGKWYYCIRLLENSGAQIGWATTGFTPSKTIGLGQDAYSWSFDGSQNKLFHQGEYPYALQGLNWQPGDVCGCGIDIDGDRISITYWLNGHCLGTAFEHQRMIGTSTTPCNFLPNGRGATYFPAVTLKVNGFAMSCCEFIFSPDDMRDCPLPKDYKPLLLPTVIDTDYGLAPYPCHAYKIGNARDEDWMTPRQDPSSSILRDFVNDGHGRPFRIDDHGSWTIAFDLRSSSHKRTDDLILVTFDRSELHPIRMPAAKVTSEPTHVAIVLDADQHQFTLYLNHELQHIPCPTITACTGTVLPDQTGLEINNIARWNYMLSQESIQRLFTQGLSYITMDRARLNSYRQRANVILFDKNQQEFLDDGPLQFHGRRIERTDHSTLQFFGRDSCLVLNKSKEPWRNYRLILEILVKTYPKENERLTLISIQHPGSELYLAHDGHLHLSETVQSTSIVPLNEVVQVRLTVQDTTVEVYLNASLILQVPVHGETWAAKTATIDLFREVETTQNTSPDDQCRLECRSISYVDSLERSINPPFSVLAPSLLFMGYDENSIRTALQEHPIRDMRSLDAILRRGPNLVSKLGPWIDRDQLKRWIPLPSSQSKETIMTLSEALLLHWDDLKHPVPFDLNNEDLRWFGPFVAHLGLTENFNSWIRDKTSKTDDVDLIYQLNDFRRRSMREKQKSAHHSLHYHHRSLTQQDYETRRRTCDQALISIHAQNLILNLLKIWLSDGTSHFPWQKLVEESSWMMEFLRAIAKVDSRDRLRLFLQSMWKIEQAQVLAEQKLTPFFYNVQKELIFQWYSCLVCATGTNLQGTMEFILNVINEFTQFISDSPSKFQRDALVSILFPASLINLLFDLFLISPSHDTKISVLHFYATHLIQSDPHFHLDAHIQSFLQQLFLRIPPNSTARTTRLMKTFQISVMDVVFLQTKDPKQYPSLFADLRIAMEHIARLESSVDQHLMHLVNRHPSLETLLSQPITDPFLSHLPLGEIETRAATIYEFNALIERLVSLLDLSIPVGQSFLTDRIRSARRYILTTVKQQLLSTSVALTEADSSIGTQTVRFDTVAASTNATNQGQCTMFNQAFEQLFSTAHAVFRLPNDQLWLAQYLGMHSTDQGGPYRDSITRICADICSTRLPLFVPCPNARTSSGLNRDRWIPNVFPPHQPIPKRIRNQYRFIGQLMGMAIRKKHYLDLKFPILLWKQLVGQEITLDDIEAIDCQSFTMIKEMEKTCQALDNDVDLNEIFSSIMDELHFEALSASGETFELIPGGKEIPITAKNFKDYCDYYRQYRRTEFRRQIEFIRQGLHSVVPGYFLNLYTAEELEEAVCGKMEVDVELLKRHTNYNGHYTPESTEIQQFWTILKDVFNEDQRKSFLTFVWGRSTLPTRDEDFTSSFTINPYDLPAETVDGALPRSHTCSFALDLPSYSSLDVMYDRLNYAITYCSSIDGDGAFNDPPPPASQLVDADSDAGDA